MNLKLSLRSMFMKVEVAKSPNDSLEEIAEFHHFLLKCLLEGDPAKRWSAKAALMHGFVSTSTSNTERTGRTGSPRLRCK